MVERTQCELWPISNADAAWIERACWLDTFRCDVAFTVSESVYIGPDNDIGPGVFEQSRVHLPPFDLPLLDGKQILSEDLIGHENALAAHYGRLIRVAADHGKTHSLRHPFPYFALNPVILAGGRALATFPWSDDVLEARAVMDTLAQVRPGTCGIVLDDQDQGWGIRFAIKDNAMYFVEWDAEEAYPKEGGYGIDALTLVSQARLALGRLETIHARLIQMLGRDYWTYRHDPPLRTLHHSNRLRQLVGTLMLRLPRWK